jgi:hypothetical protein
MMFGFDTAIVRERASCRIGSLLFKVPAIGMDPIKKLLAKKSSHPAVIPDIHIPQPGEKEVLIQIKSDENSKIAHVAVEIYPLDG